MTAHLTYGQAFMTAVLTLVTVWLVVTLCVGVWQAVCWHRERQEEARRVR